MYGSYPEITTTARYLKPLITRFLYFNKNTPKLKKLSGKEMIDIEKKIYENNQIDREKYKNRSFH